MNRKSGRASTVEDDQRELQDRTWRLDRETLKSIDELKGMGAPVDVARAGSMLILGVRLADAEGSPLNLEWSMPGDSAPVPSDRVPGSLGGNAFFNHDGSRIVVVTGDGRVRTLRPRE